MRTETYRWSDDIRKHMAVKGLIQKKHNTGESGD